MTEANVYGVSHTPDGYVAVFNGQLKYVDTLAHFNADFGVTMPAITAPANNRVYQQGIRHALILSGNVVGGGPIPWTFGDSVISNINTGIAAQKARRPASISGTPLPP